ncbi:MAG: hypothetical protein E3J58_01285 [Actinomycetota bacterium]|nr:MAG: hypothetical protein E3J58_01285 [Actinomycetota bacterium]
MIREIRKRLKRKNEKKIMETIVVLLLSAFIAFIAFYSMRLGRFVSLIIFALGFIPILIAYFLRIDLKKMLPDIIFGIIDNLILVIPAIIGAELFGAAGALTGAIIGNAISDAIAGYFEGNLSEFLHSRGIDATRTVMGSSLGKMSGCLLVGIFLIFF